MKKIISLLVIFVLIFAGYHFFTGDYLANNDYIGGTGGGGNYDDTTNNFSSGGSSTTTPITREKFKIHLEYDNTDYEEVLCFDFFNKENCDCYSDWTYVETGTKYGEYNYTLYFAVINGYPCVLQIPGVGPTLETEFFSIDWVNYEFESSPISKLLSVFNLDFNYALYRIFNNNTMMSTEINIMEFTNSNDSLTSIFERYNVDTSKCYNHEINFDKNFDNIIGLLFKPSYTHELATLKIGDVNYNEYINFDIASRNNNESYSDFAQAGSFAPSGFVHYIYSATINGYSVYFSLYNQGGNTLPTELNEFLAFDWSNYYFSTTEYMKILIVDPDNTLQGKYYLSSEGEITLLEQTTLNASASDYPFSAISDFSSDNTIAYVLDLKALDTIIYSSDETSTLSLRNVQQEDSSSNTCSYVGEYLICDEYEKESELDGYTWGPIIWPDEEE